MRPAVLSGRTFAGLLIVTLIEKLFFKIPPPALLSIIFSHLKQDVFILNFLGFALTTIYFAKIINESEHVFLRKKLIYPLLKNVFVFAW